MYAVKCARQSLPSLPLLHVLKVWWPMKQRAHIDIGRSWLRNVSASRNKKLPEELGAAKKKKKKTTAAQTKAPKGGLSFGWTAFKNAPSLLWIFLKWLFYFFPLHNIGTELKCLQIQRKCCVLYIYVSVILTKTSSGQHGHVLLDHGCSSVGLDWGSNSCAWFQCSVKSAATDN